MYIYHNLPDGGALRTLNSLLNNLTRGSFAVLKGISKRPKNIIQYLYIALIENYLYDRSISRNLDTKLRLIVFQSWLTNTPYILMISSNIKKYYICHEPLREFYDQVIIRNKNIKDRIIDLIRLPIKWIDHYVVTHSKATIIANSKYSQNNIWDAYKKQSVVIYPGYNNEIFKPKHNIKKVNQIISVGAVNKLKGYECLINAVGNINLNKPDLVIVGNGGSQQYVDHLYKIANKNNVNLRILINISDVELRKEYSLSRAFVFAPISEPFGIVVLEAMSMGLPIVCYKNGGGYIEILSNSNGLIMDNLNPLEWAHAISELLNDDLILNRISSFNENYARKFTQDKYADKLLKIFDM